MNDFWTKPRGVILLMVLVSGIMGWWAVAPVMRESDQASLLSGALELGRSWDPVGRDFYNYDKQWLSYWLVGTAIRTAGAESQLGLPGLVELGNRVTFLVGWSGVGLALLVGAGRSWTGVLVGGALLLTPVWFLSQSLLSSNVLAAGLLGFWIVAVGPGAGNVEHRKIGWILLAGLLAFAAVGCRADSVLVLPAWCVGWWGVGRSWMGIWKEKILWASGIGAVAALVFGAGISIEPGSVYPPFFEVLSFGGFLGFGLGGVLCWFLAAAALLFARRRKLGRGEWFREFAWVALMMLPLVFYGRVLFSPRHLMTTALVITLGACFLSPAAWWARCWQDWQRVLLVGGTVVLLGTMVFGVRLHSLRSGRVVFGGQATRYPSADGHWPMGGYLPFWWDLARAQEVPLDHNQRAWGAWTRVSPDAVPEGTLYLASAGLRSLGELWATWHGRELVSGKVEMEEGGHLLFDDRALTKKSVSVDGDQGSRNLVSYLEGISQAAIIGEFLGGRILVADAVAEEASDFLPMARLVRERGKGNGFVIRKASEWMNLPREERDQRRLIILEEADGSAPEAWGEVVDHDERMFQIWLGKAQPGFLDRIDLEGVWIATSELPTFMSVGSY